MKIAVSSQNFRTITGHAGKARRFLIFDISEGGEAAESARLDLPKELSFHEYHGGAHPIDGVSLLVTQSCGEGFRMRMMQRGIEVVVTGESDPLAAVNRLARGEGLAPPRPHDDDHACGCGH